MVQREKYLKNIRPFYKKPVIKVITGIRRCGKSVLLQQVRDELLASGIRSERMIAIDKELHEFDGIVNYRDLHDYVAVRSKNNSPTGYFVFIDEVQEIEHWEKTINSLLAEQKYDIYITGSNARLLSSELATLLAGRYVEFQIHTLSFSEFLMLRETTSAKKGNEGELFEEYLKYGGFPALHNFSWEEIASRQYLQSIYDSVILKDIIMRNQVRDVAMLHRILHFLADNTGNITTAKNISDYVKSLHYRIAPETVQNYIQYAVDSYILNQAKRYDVKGKRLLELHEKYYLADPGLLFALTGYDPAAISQRLENVVMNEMLTRGFSVTVGKTGTYEIDFICEKGNEKLYLQVCKSLYEGNASTREYRAFEGIDDHFPKYVLSMDNGFDTNRNGVKWMNIKDFLLAEK